MLEERLQEKILNTIDEMSYIQTYIYKENNLDRLESINDGWFDKRNILRLLLSIQIPDRVERNTVLDYICDGIERRAWQEFVNAVETRD
jgi:hypothetical protein